MEPVEISAACAGSRADQSQRETFVRGKPLWTKGFRGGGTVGGRCLSRPMTAIAHQPHRVTRAVAEVRSQLSSVAEVPLWSMDAGETAATITDLQSAKAQLAELEGRLLLQAEAVDLPGQT